MVIVDTTVWVDYLTGVDNPETAWLNRELHRQRIGLTDLILCEVLQGVRNDTTFQQVASMLLEFEVFNTGGPELSIAAAQNFRTLRRRGVTIRKRIDCLIATFCLRQQHSLLHRDRDYHAFERELGLQVVPA
jgi:predicted nucleic acid-binding protein